MKRVALIAAILVPLSPLSAAAQVTPDHAAALQKEITDWLHSTLGDVGAAGRNPVTVTAAGDHFDLAAPFAAAPGAPVMTGKMTDAGNGRWAIADIVIPSPSVFHFKLPPPKKPGDVGGDATTTLTLGEQKQQALVDPTFATPSTSSSTFGDMGLTTQFASVTQLSHVDTGTSNTTVTPTGDGRLDVAADATLTGYSMKMSGGGKETVAVAVGKASLASSFLHVSRERGLEVMHLLARAGRIGQADGGKPARMDLETSRALLTALADLATSGTMDERIDDLAVTVQGKTGSLKQMGIGLASQADAGKLQARMKLSAEGLTLPDLGLGDAVALVPTQLSLTPKLSGVPTGAVTRIARKLLDSQDPDDTDIGALFGEGPVNAGIDDIHLDVAGSSFAGNLAFVAASPNSFSGVGQITAENIDKLQQAMSATPQTAQMAPLLIFLKGIGRSEQNRTVWDIVYRDGRVLVNGQDMAALTGGPSPRQRPAPRP